MAKIEELSIWADCKDGHTWISGYNSDQVEVGKVMKMVGIYTYQLTHDASGTLHADHIGHVEVTNDAAK